PVPGANDGASGVALLLGVADALKARPPALGVDLLFVDGEDYGDFAKDSNDVLIGTRYFTAHQPPGYQPLFAVLFDMVADKDQQFYYEGSSQQFAPEVVDRVWRAMDDRRAALLLAILALAGAGVRFALAPTAVAPGDVHLVSADTPPAGGLRDAARTAARLARPVLPGERVDLDRADVTEITRLPRIGPAFAHRIVAWREQHGLFGGLARFDSVPGVGPKLVEALRPYVLFSGVVQ